MSSTQKGLNMKCADWRDRKQKGKAISNQMADVTYCMQQDCQQSMETVSCRFTDDNGFCYTDSGQEFCKKNRPHSLCKDLGPGATSTNLAGAGAWAPLKDKPTYDSTGALANSEQHFSCACFKNCNFKKDSVKVVYCDTAKGAPFKVLQILAHAVGQRLQNAHFSLTHEADFRRGVAGGRACGVTTRSGGHDN